MEKILLSPPVAFFLLLALTGLISLVSKKLSARGVYSQGKEQAYACGETVEENKAQPDYSEFFKFAFFFTIMHVIVLVVATDPMGLSVTSAVYLSVTMLSLFMLLRR